VWNLHINCEGDYITIIHSDCSGTRNIPTFGIAVREVKGVAAPTVVCRPHIYRHRFKCSVELLLRHQSEVVQRCYLVILGDSQQITISFLNTAPDPHARKPAGTIPG